jgi:glycerophosphoryl diester phosphodiesterase
MMTLCLFVIVVTACGEPGAGDDVSSARQDSTAFDKQGHRGSRGLMPENTIPAMIKAIDLGVTTLEMDVVITADKKVLLSHDTHFNPLTTTAPGDQLITKNNQDSFTIYRMTYEQTQGFDVGLKPYPAFPKQQKMAVTKPLLTDVIDSVENYIKRKGLKSVYYNIETKCSPKGDTQLPPAPEEFVSLLMQVVNSKNIAERTIVQSFDFRTLQVLHRTHPGIHLAALVENTGSLDSNIKALGFVPSVYSPYFRLVDAGLIRKCHEMKMKIIPWTVNDKEKITALKKEGVDGVISDYPDLFN